MKPGRGFSMLDLLVGLCIGLLVALAVFATTTFVGAQRRASISGHGAFEAGLGAVVEMQHAIKSAGIGVWLGGHVVCPTINVYRGSTIADGAAIAPVVIDAGEEATDSDSITVAYSDSVLGNNGIPLALAMTSAASAMRAVNARGIAVGDLVIVGNSGTSDPCTLMQVTGVADAGFGRWDIAHAAGTWNPADPATAFTHAPAYVAGSMVYDIGAFNWISFRVQDSHLEAVNLITGAAEVIADDIVQMKAYYGTSNGTTPQIEQWVPATDAWSGPLDAAHIAAIRALRIAVVSRSQHPEKPSIVGGACDATTAAPESWAGGPALDLSDNAGWQCYKYRTLTVVAPLKNVIFGAAGS